MDADAKNEDLAAKHHEALAEALNELLDGVEDGGGPQATTSRAGLRLLSFLSVGGLLFGFLPVESVWLKLASAAIGAGLAASFIRDRSPGVVADTDSERPPLPGPPLLLGPVSPTTLGQEDVRRQVVELIEQRSPVPGFGQLVLEPPRARRTPEEALPRPTKREESGAERDNARLAVITKLEPEAANPILDALRTDLQSSDAMAFLAAYHDAVNEDDGRDLRTVVATLGPSYSIDIANVPPPTMATIGGKQRPWTELSRQQKADYLPGYRARMAGLSLAARERLASHLVRTCKLTPKLGLLLADALLRHPKRLDELLSIDAD